MYYFSNPFSFSKEQLRRQLMPGLSQRRDETDYYLEKPLRLQLISFHPRQAQVYYMLTSLEPDLSIYLTLEKQEASALLTGSLHHHDYFELMYILEGNVYQKIENRRHLYTAGSCCLMNRNVRHSEEYLDENGDFRILFLQISKSLLKQIYDLFSLRLFASEQAKKLTELEEFLQINLSAAVIDEKDYVDFIPLKDDRWIREHTHRLFDELADILVAPEKNSSQQIALIITRIIQQLASKDNYTTTPVRIGSPEENRLFEQIRQYMKLSNGRISRDELSQILHYSGSHLNRIVHQYTGMSISEYGLTVCMKEVAARLRTEDIPIQEIAQEMRFSNQTHFYRKFQDVYHMTPAQYRKKCRS